MPKLVAVILVNWNTPVHTVNCITSLKQYCDQNLFDVIVVDNGSSDNSLSIIQSKFPHLIYIDNKKNLGFAEGNNSALTYSLKHGYTYSLVLNTDTLVDEDIIIRLSTHLNHHPEAGAVQPAIYWMHNKDQIWNGEGSFNPFLGTTSSSTKQPDRNRQINFKSVDWLTGCCMLIRNSALLKSGFFNSLFFLYFEDVDLSFRLRNEGFELHYLSTCKLYHEAGVSARAIPKKKEGPLSPIIHYYISRNHLWIIRRYGKPFFYPVNIIYNGIYYSTLLIYFVLRGRNEKAKLLIKGLKEGIFTAETQIWPAKK